MTMLVLCIQPDAFNNNDDNLFSHDARVHSKPNTDGWWACIAHSNDAACSCWRKNPFYAPHLPSAHSRKWRKCITHVNGTACKRSRAMQSERMALVPVWCVCVCVMSEFTCEWPTTDAQSEQKKGKNRTIFILKRNACDMTSYIHTPTPLPLCNVQCACVWCVCGGGAKKQEQSYNEKKNNKIATTLRCVATLLRQVRHRQSTRKPLNSLSHLHLIPQGIAYIYIYIDGWNFCWSRCCDGCYYVHCPTWPTGSTSVEMGNVLASYRQKADREKLKNSVQSNDIKWH